MNQLIFLDRLVKIFGIQGLTDYETKICCRQFKNPEQLLTEFNQSMGEIKKLFLMSSLNLARKKYQVDSVTLAISVFKKLLSQAQIPFEIVRSSKDNYMRLTQPNILLFKYINEMDNITHSVEDIIQTKQKTIESDSICPHCHQSLKTIGVDKKTAKEKKGKTKLAFDSLPDFFLEKKIKSSVTTNDMNDLEILKILAQDDLDGNPRMLIVPTKQIQPLINQIQFLNGDVHIFVDIAKKGDFLLQSPTTVTLMDYQQCLIPKKKYPDMWMYWAMGNEIIPPHVDHCVFQHLLPYPFYQTTQFVIRMKEKDWRHFSHLGCQLMFEYQAAYLPANDFWQQIRTNFKYQLGNPSVEYKNGLLVSKFNNQLITEAGRAQFGIRGQAGLGGPMVLNIPMIYHQINNFQIWVTDPEGGEFKNNISAVTLKVADHEIEKAFPSGSSQLELQLLEALPRESIIYQGVSLVVQVYQPLLKNQLVMIAFDYQIDQPVAGEKFVYLDRFQISCGRLNPILI